MKNQLFLLAVILSVISCKKKAADFSPVTANAKISKITVWNPPFQYGIGNPGPTKIIYHLFYGTNDRLDSIYIFSYSDDHLPFIIRTFNYYSSYYLVNEIDSNSHYIPGDIIWAKLDETGHITNAQNSTYSLEETLSYNDQGQLLQIGDSQYTRSNCCVFVFSGVDCTTYEWDPLFGDCIHETGPHSYTYDYTYRYDITHQGQNGDAEKIEAFLLYGRPLRNSKNVLNSVTSRVYSYTTSSYYNQTDNWIYQYDGHGRITSLEMGGTTYQYEYY